jgi:hypothetical protein
MASKAEARAEELGKTYDDFKTYEGRRYTGMKVGRSHKWYYDQGEWKEKKITPDLWQISYAVTKRRAGRAPEGSGVPVGTEYHWYILAHQHVRKLNANDYTTSLAGLKFKVAHRRSDNDKWSASERTQRKRMVNFLRGVIEDLEREPESAAVVQELAASAPARPAAKRSSAAKQSATRSGQKPARKSGTSTATRARRAPPSVMKRSWKRRAARR